MAEQEVIKHTKKVYKIWNSRQHGFWYKFREFVIEIVIIVFAVSLSIWFHSRSEHKHQQQVAKDFLTGLKSDLSNDIKELEDAKNSYLLQEKAFAYFRQAIKNGSVLNADSVKAHSGWIFFATTTYRPKASRFEGLKSAGQLYYIENKELLNEILGLYQDKLPWLVQLITSYVDFKTNKLVDYYDIHLMADGDYTTRLNDLLKQPVMQRYLQRGSLVQQIIDEIDQTSEQCKHIIVLIEKEMGKN